jgi:hypothetical protein
MKITKNSLKRIIAEELSRVISEQGFFSTGPDTDRRLSTGDAMMLAKAGFDTSDIDEDSLTPAMKAALGRQPSLPDEFVQGSGSAFIDSPHKGVRGVMNRADYGEDSAPEDLIAIALAARAVELYDPDGDMPGVEVKVSPDVFKRKAMSIYQDYVVGKSGDSEDGLRDIITRISIDYFDEDIEEIFDMMQQKTRGSTGGFGEGHPYDNPPGEEWRHKY